MDFDSIMEDIIRMDMDFLGNDNLWEPFMKKVNKNLLALNTERDLHKAEVDEMEKKVAMAEEALEKSDAIAEQERQARVDAEAMLARERKAWVELEAKVFALEDLVKGLQSQIKAMLENRSFTNQPDLN